MKTVKTGTVRSRIKRGDQVVFIAGKEFNRYDTTGKRQPYRGKVVAVDARTGKVKVEGAMIVKRHRKPVPQMNREGGIIEQEAWVNISNVALIDPETGKPTKAKYETRDGKHIALGSNEPQFYRNTLALLGLAADDLPAQQDQQGWPEMRERFAAVFKTRTRDEWCEIMAGQEVCFAPVLSMGEAPEHPHLKARNTFVEYDGVVQPAPAPRFSRTPPSIQRGAPAPGEHTDEALADWGFDADARAALKATGAIK